MNIANIKRIVLVFIEIILNRKINQSRDLEKDNEFHFLYFISYTGRPRHKGDRTSGLDNNIKRKTELVYPF